MPGFTIFKRSADRLPLLKEKADEVLASSAGMRGAETPRPLQLKQPLRPHLDKQTLPLGPASAGMVPRAALRFEPGVVSPSTLRGVHAPENLSRYLENEAQLKTLTKDHDRLQALVELPPAKVTGNRRKVAVAGVDEDPALKDAQAQLKALATQINRLNKEQGQALKSSEWIVSAGPEPELFADVRSLIASGVSLASEPAIAKADAEFAESSSPNALHKSNVVDAFKGALRELTLLSEQADRG